MSVHRTKRYQKSEQKLKVDSPTISIDLNKVGRMLSRIKLSTKTPLWAEFHDNLIPPLILNKHFKHSQTSPKIEIRENIRHASQDD